jgi:hypothetical protein
MGLSQPRLPMRHMPPGCTVDSIAWPTIRVTFAHTPSARFAPAVGEIGFDLDQSLSFDPVVCFRRVSDPRDAISHFKATRSPCPAAFFLWDDYPKHRRQA